MGWKETILRKPDAPRQKPGPKLGTGRGTKRGPRPQTIARIANIAGFLIRGASLRQAASKIGLRYKTVREYRHVHRAVWQAALDAARTDAFKALQKTTITEVRDMARSQAVPVDPDAYLHVARLAEKWCQDAGTELFPANGKPTVASFFCDWYRPVRLAGASAATIELYQVSVGYWVKFTGDPPLAEITPAMLARFRDCLLGMRGRKRGSRLCNESIRRVFRHLQPILDKAGPPGPRNRDAAGLIAQSPWIRPPRAEEHDIEVLTIEQIGHLYDAAVGMDVPTFPGVKPPAWWKALIVVAVTTGLRRRSLFALRWDWVNLSAGRILIPGSAMKGKRIHEVALNDTAVRHLRAIRGNRDLVFEWPQTLSAFHADFRRLWRLAGLPPHRACGLHSLRRCHGTLLWAISPAAAQLSLGHRNVATTVASYVRTGGIVADAVRQLPQPAAFQTIGAS